VNESLNPRILSFPKKRKQFHFQLLKASVSKSYAKSGKNAQHIRISTTHPFIRPTKEIKQCLTRSPMKVKQKPASTYQIWYVLLSKFPLTKHMNWMSNCRAVVKILSIGKPTGKMLGRNELSGES
jgi:hypothetical protein